MEKFDAIIIGAGISGMTVAYELSKYYSNILVFEKELDIGGVLSSYRFDGFNIEKHYHHFFRDDLKLLDFVGELGLRDKLLWRTVSTGYYFGDAAYNLNTPAEIIGYKFLTLLDKFKLGFALFKLRYIDNLSRLDDLPARDWIIGNTSSQVYEDFFRPLIKSKFGDETGISAAWLCARIKKRSNRNLRGEKLGYLKGGFQVFFDVLAEKICPKVKIMKGTKVERISLHNNTVKGVYAQGNEYFSDKIISTVGAKTLLNLCDLPYPLKMKLKEIKEQCMVCCLFGLRKSLIKQYWLNIKSETLPFGIFVEHTNFVDVREYHGTRLVYVITYCKDENDEFFRMPDVEIAEIYLRALENQFALKCNDLLWYRVNRTSEAGLVYRIGTLKLIPERESGIAGLYLSGMIRSYPDRGINESIKDAQSCAEVILNKYAK